MSKYTTNLNLFEYDTSTDGAQVFSIDDAINENFDKIDNFAGEMAAFQTAAQNSLATINTNLGKKLEAQVLLAENGYIKFNNGFVIEHGKTGTFNCYATTTWTYPIALTTIYSIATSEKLSADTGETTTHISSIDKSSVVLYRQYTGNQTGAGYTYIIIIGKK